MNFIEQNVKGLYLIEPQLYNDNRGLFYESWTINELNKRISKKNVFRGFHYQKYPFEQNKLLKVLNGSIYDICIDIRKNSETFLKIFELKIKSSDNKILFIPKGIAHGFLSLENKTKISYLVDVKYSPLHEEGIIYNDSNLMINKNLKNKNYIISNKDKKLKNIKNLGFI